MKQQHHNLGPHSPVLRRKPTATLCWQPFGLGIAAPTAPSTRVEPAALRALADAPAGMIFALKTYRILSSLPRAIAQSCLPTIRAASHKGCDLADGTVAVVACLVNDGIGSVACSNVAYRIRRRRMNRCCSRATILSNRARRAAILASLRAVCRSFLRNQCRCTQRWMMRAE